MPTEPNGSVDHWLFGGGTGAQPPARNSLGNHWRATCKRAGVSGFTLHDLRHVYASGLIAAGCDVVTVQRALGHAQASTTLNVYAHLWPSAGPYSDVPWERVTGRRLASQTGLLS